MKKYALLAISIATIVGLVGLSSCDKDDPAPRPQISFGRATQTVTEAAGVIEVEVNLDVAAGEDITVDFDVDGTALEGAATTANSDYEITSSSGEVKIKKGQTSGIIEIKIKNDTKYEGDETIELELTGVSSTGVDITEDNTMVITISEDDLQPVASFKNSTATFNEDVFEVDVEVALNSVAGQDIILNYTVDNQEQWLQDRSIALSAEYGETQDFPSNYFDFYIDVEDEGDVQGQVTIPQGESSAFIKVRLYTDFFFEGDEEISLTLTGAQNNAATITTSANKKTTKITVEQQKGKYIELYWGNQMADLNMYLLAGENEAQLFDWNNNYLLGISAYQQKSTDEPGDAYEVVVVPTGFSELVPELDTWGLSYSYRAGNVDNLDFDVYFVDFENGQFNEETVETFSATYKLANIHDPTVEGSEPPAIEQTFTFIDGVVSDISAITVPATGSRMKSSRNPLVLKRSELESVYDAKGRKVTRIASMSGARALPVMKSSRQLNLLRH